MSKYLFLFGNTPKLSWLELQSLVPSSELVRDNVAQTDLDSEEAQQIFAKLGGSVKLIEITTNLNPDAKGALSQIGEFLANKKSSGKITFSLGILGQDLLDISETDIKKFLRDELSLSSRFIEHKQSGLSASVLLHQEKVIEVILLEVDGQVWLGQTIAVQDIDDWTKRDRRKPYADRKKGMLPPKVARMMVNIAGTEAKTIYDPFCGTGTVLAEALMTGHDMVVGSDLDGDATAGAEKNLAWLKKEYGLSGEVKIFLSDVTQINKYSDLKNNQVDVIVTEPFLGKPKPQIEQLDNIYKGLEKLYLGAFKVFKEVLKNGGKVVIVFPMVQTYKTTYSLENLIDKLEQLGYTTTSEPVLYARENAVVQRQVFVFKLTK